MVSFLESLSEFFLDVEICDVSICQYINVYNYGVSTTWGRGGGCTTDTELTPSHVRGGSLEGP